MTGRAPPSANDVANEATEFSITMAFEAFRICIGRPTVRHKPAEVFRWMRCMLSAVKPL
jgi:hypothetical protein